MGCSGRRKYKRGHRTCKNGVIWLAGCTVHKTRGGPARALLTYPAPQRNEAVLVPPLVQLARRGHTVIVTDGWRGYRGLEQHGVVHEVVVHAHQVGCRGWAGALGARDKVWVHVVVL